MASPASPPTSLRAAARDRLAPSAAFFFQVGWLVLQLGALGLALAGTPALHDLYQTACPDMVCSKLPQPTVAMVNGPAAGAGGVVGGGGMVGGGGRGLGVGRGVPGLPPAERPKSRGHQFSMGLPSGPATTSSFQ